MSRRGRPPYPDVLTPRQQEVLTLVREGLTNPEIGERLGISRDGAKFHVSEIITRIGVTTRHEAAEWDAEASPSAMLAAPGIVSILRGRRRAARHVHTASDLREAA